MTVYFALEENTGRIKIGYSESQDPQGERIDPHVTMTTSVVTVVAVLPAATRDTERSLHEAFKRSRVMRPDASMTEFFRPSPQLWALVGFVRDSGKLPCPPAGCADLVWVPK